jgi:flavin-dependent dehydrogenase
MKIIIVGAGIGGLTAHLVCRRAGFEVEHYGPEPRLGPAGGGDRLVVQRGQDHADLRSGRTP